MFFKNLITAAVLVAVCLHGVANGATNTYVIKDDDGQPRGLLRIVTTPLAYIAGRIPWFRRSTPSTPKTVVVRGSPVVAYSRPSRLRRAREAASTQDRSPSVQLDRTEDSCVVTFVNPNADHSSKATFALKGRTLEATITQKGGGKDRLDVVSFNIPNDCALPTAEEFPDGEAAAQPTVKFALRRIDSKNPDRKVVASVKSIRQYKTKDGSAYYSSRSSSEVAHRKALSYDSSTFDDDTEDPASDELTTDTNDRTEDEMTSDDLTSDVTTESRSGPSMDRYIRSQDSEETDDE